MAITLLNKSIAVKNMVPHDHYTQGVVAVKDAAVTLCAVNDTVYFPMGVGVIVIFNGVEYIVIKDADLLAKGT